MKEIATRAENNHVYSAENGQFVAFWRGNIVRKFDGALRYFDTEQTAWNFLARRDGISASILGVSYTKLPKAV